jgi:hypothetical protein
MLSAAKYLIAVTAIAAAASGAHALCIYDGVDNAKTTIPQEFRDSQWVVRAKVLSATDHWSDVDDSWTTYELKVEHAYKGSPPQRLRFFTFRDSGGFYMDRPWLKLPQGHDIGGEYLLFLIPFPVAKGEPAQTKGAVFVNYSCGLSGPWNEESPSARGMLDNLERGR